jgi:hypothetical protein
LNDDGTFKLVGLFSDIKANDGKRADERQCRQYGEKIDSEAGGMMVVERPLCDEEKENIESHRGCEAVEIAASCFCCGVALHDKSPFHKDNQALH